MFFVKKKKIAGDLSTSQRKSDNYCLEFFLSLLEKHKSKIITSQRVTVSLKKFLTFGGCSSNNPCSSKKKTKPNPGAVTRRNFSRRQPQPTRSVHP